jgi:hypothetical protein
MSDVSKDQPKMTARLDIGDNYSYLCLIDQEGGEVMEEGLLCAPLPKPSEEDASQKTLLLRGAHAHSAIEAGTHSAWVSRLLEECGHEVLVANARKIRLIYANKRKTDEIDALRTWLAWLEWTRSCSIRSSTEA